MPPCQLDIDEWYQRPISDEATALLGRNLGWCGLSIPCLGKLEQYQVFCELGRSRGKKRPNTTHSCRTVADCHRRWNSDEATAILGRNLGWCGLSIPSLCKLEKYQVLWRIWVEQGLTTTEYNSRLPSEIAGQSDGNTWPESQLMRIFCESLSNVGGVGAENNRIQLTLALWLLIVIGDAFLTKRWQ